MGTLGRMVPAVPLLTAPKGRGRHRSGHGPQRRVGRDHVHAGVDVGPASSSYMRASADSPGPYASSSSTSSASCSSSAPSPAATIAGGVSGRGGKGARGRSSAPPPLAAFAASSRARRLSGSRAQLVPAWRSMLYASPAGHGSPGATWRHSRHSHIQSSTPSPLSRLPLGSTTPPPSAGACAYGTPRPASCPPDATTSDGFSLAPSALGAIAASACRTARRRQPPSPALPARLYRPPRLSAGTPPGPARAAR